MCMMKHSSPFVADQTQAMKTHGPYVSEVDTIVTIVMITKLKAVQHSLIKNCRFITEYYTPPVILFAVRRYSLVYV